MRYWHIAVVLLFAMLAFPQTGRSRDANQSGSVLPCSSIKDDPEKMQLPSPPGCSDVKFSDGTMIVIQYSRPKLRDPKNGKLREVFGVVVPWGKVWRAGANEATSFATDANLIIGGKRVPSGAYTIYVVPERRGKPWKLILNKTTGQWGMPYPGASSDLARIDMDVTLLRDPVDQLTIELPSSGHDSTTLALSWESWRAAVNIVEEH